MKIRLLFCCCFIFLVSNSFAYSSEKALVAGQILNLKVCQTDKEKALGLGGTKILAFNQGMLFPFNKAEEQIFWMKGMVIAIDIIWLNGNDVVHIEQNVQPPNLLQVQLPQYGQGVLADSVLEVKAGFSKIFNLKVGDKITLNYQAK